MIYDLKSIYGLSDHGENENTMELFADISPRGIYSGMNEPCEVKNSLVLQLHNTTNHALTLYNDKVGATYDFLPIEQAVPIEGLTMIYFTFPLGDEEGCLTTIDYFKKACFYCSDPFEVTLVGENSLVVYPASTMTFSIYDMAEVRIENLVTQMPVGCCPICRITMFSPDGATVLNPVPIYILRHPLQIAFFEADPKYYPAGFGDQIQFNYRVLGADYCVFIPGDMFVEASTALKDHGVYTSTLYRKTQYTLLANCEDEQISSSVEIVPVKASIKSFTANVTSPVKDGRQEITFRFTVENAHHAYISMIGRVEVTSGVEQTVSSFFDCSVRHFTLSVENEDGLVQQVCDIGNG